MDEKLGVLEFCVALNGDDPILTIKSLHKFTQTIRKERRIALLLPLISKYGDDMDKTNSGKITLDLDEGYFDDDDISGHAFSKRTKTTDKEVWKEDTKSYNVPFVGTSVAKGDVGIVEPNEWPTGLLKAYLKMSPNAKELTTNGVDFIPPNGAMQKFLCGRAGNSSTKSEATKDSNLSNSLYSAYLQALNEIISAAIPKHILIRDLILQLPPTYRIHYEKKVLNGDININTESIQNNSTGSMISIVMKEQFPHLLQVLNTETREGKGYSGKHRGSDQLTTQALTILTSLTNTSTGAAREVARGLDSVLKDGTLRILFRSNRSHYHRSQYKTKDGGILSSSSKKRTADEINVEKEINTNDHVKLSIDEERGINVSDIQDTRTACLLLSSALIDTLDHTVISFVTSFGNKERKINPGIVYLALRVGLSDNIFARYFELERSYKNISDGVESVGMARRQFFESGRRLLLSFRLNLLPRYIVKPMTDIDSDSFQISKDTHNKSSNSNIKQMLNSRNLTDLLTGEPLDQILRISMNAIQLSENQSFEKVLAGIDKIDCDEISLTSFTLFEIAQEARRLLFILLCDKVRSPFLILLNSGHLPIGVKASYTQQLARCVLSLIHSSNNNIPTRNFILECLKNSPEFLLAEVFRNLSIIPEQLKPTFKCFSSFAFVSCLISKGPSVWSCLPKLQNDSLASDKKKIPVKIEQIMAYIMPKSVTKNMLNKSLSNTNALFVTETLKLLICILKRAHSFAQRLEIHFQRNAIGIQKIDSKILSPASFRDGLSRRLPDLQAIVALRSKFDPFSSSEKGNLLENSKLSHLIVVMYMCDVLDMYLYLQPQSMGSAHFDWIKMLPDSPDQFFHANPVLQRRLLKTLNSLFLHQSGGKGINIPSTKAFYMLMLILTKAQVDEVYQIARKITVSLISHVIKINSTNKEICQCNDHEANLWVDAISPQVILSFCKLIEVAQKVTVEHAIMVSQAWYSCFPESKMNIISFSPLLTTAFGSLISAPEFFKPETVLFVCQVATKMLLYNLDPLPLACVINHYVSMKKFQEKISNSECLKGVTEGIADLMIYTKSLIEGEKLKKSSMRSLSKNLFPSSKFHEQIVNCISNQLSEQCWNNFHLSHDDATSMMRQFLQHKNILADNFFYQNIRVPLLVILKQNDFDNCYSILNEVLREKETLTSFQYENEIVFIIALSWLYTQSDKNHDVHKLLELRANQKFKNLMTLFDHNNTFFSKRKNLSLLIVAAMSQTTSSSIIETSIGAILQNQLNDDQRNKSELQNNIVMAFLTNALQSKLSLGIDISSNQQFPINRTFDLWKHLATKVQRGEFDNHAVDLLRCLEIIISRTLLESEEDGFLSANLYISMKKCQINSVVDLAFSTAKQVYNCYTDSENETQHSPLPGSDTQRQLLIQSILRFDFHNVATQTLKCISQESEQSSFLNDSISSNIDGVVLEFLNALDRFSGNEYFMEKSICALSKKYCIRASILFDQANKERKWLRRNLEILVRLIPWCDFGSGTFEKLFVNMLNELNQTLETPRKICKSDLFSAIICFVVTIIERREDLQNRDFFDFDSWKKLISTAYLCLCSAMPHVMRRKMNQNDKVFFLKSTLNLLNETGMLDEDIIIEGYDQTQTLLVTSLKHGIAYHTDQDDAQIADLCLQVVNRFLLIRSNPVPSNRLFSESIINPVAIHNMIVSHSKFRECITSKDQPEKMNFPLILRGEIPPHKVKSKLQLINTLKLCASMKSYEILINKETWYTLLKSYNAGLSKEDEALRNLMFIYEKNSRAKTKEPEIFMDELKWGEYQLRDDKGVNIWNESLNVSSDHALNWEWFIQGLDSRRIKQTIDNFPLMDRLEPNQNFNDNPLEGLDLMMESCDHEINDDDSMASESLIRSSSLANNKDKKATTEFGTMVEAGFSDERYSPGFILPLILAALESFAPSIILKNCSNNDSPTSIASNHFRQTKLFASNDKFAKIAMRLSQKGAIALALASLSSKCSKLRQVSVSIFFLFLQALNCEEAHNLNSWRERPQLVMVINSIQRSFAVKRSMQLQNENTSSSSKETKRMLVPMLPAVSSIFLAKSLLILTRPGDDLYAQINRFFLRLNKFHGAFIDCFSLPAFIALYCSVVDDYVQARKERVWALQLLKNGIIDLTSYKVIIRCHVPELLLTSFESRGSRKFHAVDEGEQILLLETIIGMLENGGELARHHLLTKIGLLSWIVSTIEGHRFFCYLPTMSLRHKFLDLIKISVKSVSIHFDGEEIPSYLVIEMINLLRSLVNMYCGDEQDVISTTDYLENSKMDEPTIFLSNLCDTIWSIHLSLIHSSTYTITPGLANCNGISLMAASRILRALGAKSSYYNSMIVAFCHFNYRYEKQHGEDAHNICLNAITYFLQNDEMIDSKQSHLTVLRYINSLLRAFPDQMVSDVTCMLLACRKRALEINGGLEAWCECLKTIVRISSESCKTLEDSESLCAGLAGEILSLCDT